MNNILRKNQRSSGSCYVQPVFFCNDCNARTTKMSNKPQRLNHSFDSMLGVRASISTSSSSLLLFKSLSVPTARNYCHNIDSDKHILTSAWLTKGTKGLWLRNFINLHFAQNVDGIIWASSRHFRIKVVSISQICIKCCNALEQSWPYQNLKLALSVHGSV